MSKKNPNGKVVLYTETGTKVVTADNTLNIEKGLKYLVIGAVKEIPPPPDWVDALKPVPQIIDEALKYTQTKFFRLIIDLMKLAQFDPFDGGAFGVKRFLTATTPDEYFDDGIDYSVTVPEIDAQLYKKYGFSAAMIEFVERKYSYDDGAGLEPR